MISIEYRPIDSKLLGKDFDCNFALYYLAKVEGQARFVMFADSIPQHIDKVRGLLASGDLEHELYIKEEDMVQYFARATEVLRDMVKDPNRPASEKAAKIYDVSKNVMQEFFEFHAPPQLLLNSEPVMEMMDDVLTDKSMGFSGLARILNKDYYTYTHSVNVGMYCMTFGVKRDMPEGDVRELGVGGMLHDAGKVKIPPEIINKNGKLTDEEFEEIKKHPEYGEEMLAPMGCFGQAVLTMAGQHHEKYRGGGYPRSLAGEAISYSARVCKVMDVYDALTTRRSYKPALQPFKALALMSNEMTPEFDPEILQDFVTMLGTADKG